MAIFADEEENDPELVYYRTIEDFFARLRGVRHDLSPKDWQLMRKWWRQQVPLSAVTTGVTEVFTRRSDRGETLIFSLGYCRHAVQRHARQLAEMNVGRHGEARPAAASAKPALQQLVQRLQAAAAAQEQLRPRVAETITKMLDHVQAAVGLPEEAVEEHLFSLEIALLEGCRQALEQDELQQIEAQAEQAAEAAGAVKGERDRLFRAMRDRAVRDLLSLPRLEVA